jgi:hypothetical protein
MLGIRTKTLFLWMPLVTMGFTHSLSLISQRFSYFCLSFQVLKVIKGVCDILYTFYSKIGMDIIISFLNKWLVYNIHLIWLSFSIKTLKLLQMIFWGVLMELENYMGPWISYMWHLFCGPWSWIWLGAHVYDPFCCRLLTIALCEMKAKNS